ncbi:hypothetical protein QAD02_001078 [Eretmocerus hayati]|uniref:Uncharacterized protein n=1 Tax=Eretmocerus hayati TaxID=131215 RepID=A0ACC2NF12_9HYME|nr:hypothetical protein QAD02_001078 [Eretmocerus hayati]
MERIFFHVVMYLSTLFTILYGSPDGSTTLATSMTITDACTPEGIEEIEELELANEKLNELREEVISLWSRPIIPESMRHRSSVQSPSSTTAEQPDHANQNVGSETSEQRRIRLEQEKQSLTWRISLLESSIRHYGILSIGSNECGTGSCDGGNGDRSRPSRMRMYRAMHEARYQNMCNRLIESGMELNLLNEELDRIIAESTVLACSISGANERYSTPGSSYFYETI